MSTPRVAVVVLNWNGGDETLACLESLRKVRGQPPAVILADNGSTDGSVERAQADHPDLIVLRHGTNLGYAGGNNPRCATRWTCWLSIGSAC
jgi:GT2 family glycosyltransferase